jgi:molecular chaperone DnaK
VPQIEVSFEIDVNGILKVSAQDKGTSREQSIRITNTGGLSAVEVEQMRKEAETYAEQDKKRVQLIDLKNQADTLFYSYESNLKDNSDLISEDFKRILKDEVEELKAVFNDPAIAGETVKEKLNNFRELLFSIGTDVYKQASPGNQTESNSSEQSVSEQNTHSEDNTVIADYEAIE